MSIDEKADAYCRCFHAKQLAKPDCCEVCRCAGRLRWHGSYTRTLIATSRSYILPIKRLLCVLCGHTFALLPDFVEKFHRYAKEVINSALRWLKSQTYEAVAEVIANSFPEPQSRNIAPLTLYLWRRKFV